VVRQGHGIRPGQAGSLWVRPGSAGPMARQGRALVELEIITGAGTDGPRMG